MRGYNSYDDRDAATKAAEKELLGKGYGKWSARNTAYAMSNDAARASKAAARKKAKDDADTFLSTREPWDEVKKP